MLKKNVTMEKFHSSFHFGEDKETAGTFFQYLNLVFAVSCTYLYIRKKHKTCLCCYQKITLDKYL